MSFKTNVMRILDNANIHYISHCFANTDAVSGIEVANALNQNINKVFKTLVTIGKSNMHYVFLLPVNTA